MAERVQVRDLRAAPEIRPAARPIDTYYRPVANPVAKPQPSEFDALAQAFTQAAPGIVDLAVGEFQKRADEEIRKGAAARDLNKKNFKEATKLGLIKEAQNPWFIKGWMQQDGRVQGMDYDAALRTAWASDPVRNSKNPQDIQAFIQKFREGYLRDKSDSTGNLDWMDGFRGKMVASESNLGAQHVAHVQSEISKEVRENTGRELLGTLRNAEQAGTISAPDAATAAASREALGTVISARLKAMVDSGLDGSDANATAIEVLAVHALETKDPSVFAIADHITTGPGGKLSGTAPFKAKKLQVENQLKAQERQDRREAWDLEDRPHTIESQKWAVEVREKQRETWKKQQISEDKKERSDSLLADLATSVLAKSPLDPDKLNTLARLSPRDAQWVKAWKKADLNPDVVTDQDAYGRLMIRIAEDPSKITARDIFGGAMGGSPMWNMPDARAAFNEWQQIKQQKETLKLNPHADSVIQNASRAIASTETSLKGEGPTNLIVAEGKLRRAAVEIYNRTDLTAMQKEIEFEKRAVQIVEYYNKLGASRSKAAQDLGVSQKPSLRDDTNKPVEKKEKKPSISDAPGIGPLDIHPSETAKKNKIPDAAVKDLLDSPWTVRQFDETFGEGMGEAIMRESLYPRRKGK